MYFLLYVAPYLNNDLRCSWYSYRNYWYWYVFQLKMGIKKISSIIQMAKGFHIKIRIIVPLRRSTKYRFPSLSGICTAHYFKAIKLGINLFIGLLVFLWQKSFIFRNMFQIISDDKVVSYSVTMVMLLILPRLAFFQNQFLITFLKIKTKIKLS